MSKLINIDFEKGVLKTPKHKYKISKSLSLDRYMQFELLQPQAAYGITFNDFFEQDKKVIEHLNKTEWVNAATIVMNRQEQFRHLNDKRRHAMIQICALWLNREDEDLKTFDQTISDEKIQDWLESGVDYKDFFRLAVNLVPGLLEASQEVFQIISGAMGQVEETAQLLNELAKSKEK